jgi:integrase
MKWSQVDFQRNFIHLIRTKSGKQRAVPINSIVREELRALQLKSGSEFVFTSPFTGRALTGCKRAFTKARKLAGVEDLHFHDLRHTAATRMADTGAEPSTIKDILGHSDIRMTDRYTHAVEARKRTALERLANFGRSAEVISLYERKGA